MIVVCNIDYREKNIKSFMLAQAKFRAKTKGIPFEITQEDINIPERCPILNIPLKVNIGKSGSHYDSPSLDRIDNSKGYTKDNIHVISGRANKIKADASLNELELITNYLKSL